MMKSRTRGAVKLILAAFLLFITCEARASAPTLISYTETAWNTGAASKSTAATVSWLTNDVVVVIGGSEAADTLAVPTATGLTFVSQKSNAAAGTCGTQLAAVVAGSAGTNQAVSMGNSSSSSHHWGFAVWVWRGSQGIGNSSEQHTATKTVNMTPAAGADAGVVWGAFDFQPGTGPAATPTPTDTRQAFVDGTHYGVVVADITDQASAGAVAYGLTTVTGVAGPYSIVVLEIETGAGGAAPAGMNKRQKLEQLDP